MQTQTVTNEHVFHISGWNQQDVVRLNAEERGLLVHVDFPGIEYAGEFLKLGLSDFPSAHTSNSYSTAIVPEIEASKANSTSRLASLLLFFQDQIPVEWRMYDLILPGTGWISPDKHRGFTRMSFKKDEQSWKFSFQPIEQFPVFTDCRFVIDCRDIVFPERVGNW